MDIKHLIEIASQALESGDLVACENARRSLKQALRFHNPPVIQARAAERHIKQLGELLRGP
jgi:hypothetical protein